MQSEVQSRIGGTPAALSHNRKTSTGRTVTTKPLTTEFLLLILSILAVADSVTDLAGWDAGRSVVTQEACAVIGGCTEAVHWRESQKYFIVQHFYGMKNRSTGRKRGFLKFIVVLEITRGQD